MIAISIHAPRAGCDTGDGVVVTKNEISIHAPRAGCDVAIPDSFVYSLQFQSTHPVRGATGSARRRQVRSGISIHAPRAGCDNAWRYITRRQTDFNPRTPCGVRLRRCLQSTQTATFQSTHPVRGATWSLSCSTNDPTYFNPRTPCGVRQRNDRQSDYDRTFQSTHPVRGATQSRHLKRGSADISIHAPRAGCDRQAMQDAGV